MTGEMSEYWKKTLINLYTRNVINKRVKIIEK